MAGSTIGTCFRVTTWGESHGPAVGAVIDGCPAGLALSEETIQKYMDRRRPGASAFASARQEKDAVEILSGVLEGRTTGTPVSLLVRNADARPEDYRETASCYRPGHADYTYEMKYGVRDWRGGGRASGRETAARVAAGAVAEELLRELGVSLRTFVRSIGPVTVPEEACDWAFAQESPLRMPDRESEARAEAYVRETAACGDSAGGVVECRISGVPAGIGEPVFQKLDAALAGALMSVGAVKGVEIGDGFAAAGALGSENNDAFACEDGRIRKETNHAGGILGGISDGDVIVLRAAVKPTPSIAKEQRTVRADGEPVMLQAAGRHDPVIAPRAAAVVQAMAAIVLADEMLCGMHARLEDVRGFYAGRPGD
ncbi:MAG: chorismate synthase [Lachnospiraceae bacterium]|nr:chorismate synthase [Lachnospiraceae bacterium]